MPLSIEQIHEVSAWLNEWEQIKDSVIPVRFKEDFYPGAVQMQGKPEIDKAYLHEQMRRKLWCDVATGVASLFNCKDKDAPVGWADYVLREFDNRFK